MTIEKTVLVLFSGGQDSATCLAWSLERFRKVVTVGFAYGQRHSAELDARPLILERIRKEFPGWDEKLGADHLLSLEVLSEIGGSALTEDLAIEMGRSGLPTSFVPGRNLLFLTSAAALASRLEIHDLVGGMCETDYSGYPDCRSEAITAMEKALQLGMAEPFVIHTPLMKIDKAETWRLAESLGGQALIDLIVEETVTCYLGDREHRHVWGTGCGSCPACALRAAGFEQYRAGAG